MQKIKIKTIHIKTPRIKTPRMVLEYYLLLKGGECGIEIRDTYGEESAARFIPDVAEKVYKFLVKLARHTVTPDHLDDVVDDYIYERWQSKRRLYLLQTNPRAGLDCGKRDGQTVGDLLTGKTANEG